MKPYVDALRLDSVAVLWRIAEKINRGVIPGQGRALQGDALEVLPTLKADVCYLDPPYPATAAYETEYRVLDEILEGRAIPRSTFSAKSGVAMVDTLFERARHIPLLVLSFGNAVANLEELESKMARSGRYTRAISIRHTHKAAQASAEKNEKNREFLLIGVDPRSTLPLRLEGARGEVAV